MAIIVEKGPNARFQGAFDFGGGLEWVPPTEFPTLGKTVAVDTETCDPLLKSKGPSWVFDEGHVSGISVADDMGFVGYFPIGHVNGSNMDQSQVIRWLQVQLADPDRDIVFMNATYDLGWLDRLGIPVKGQIHDVMLMAPLVYEHMWSFSLDTLMKFYLKKNKLKGEMDENLREFGLRGMENLWKLPAQKVGPYAERDAAGTLELFFVLRERIEKEDLQAVYDVERGLIPCMFEMRKRGVRVNVAGAERMLDVYKKNEKDSLAFVKTETGIDLGPWDADKIAKALIARGHNCEMTPAGNASVTKDFLVKVVKETSDPVAQAVLQARVAQKTYGTFLEGFILEYQHKGRIHAQYNQMKSDAGGTISGRFSSSSPNMQQLPARDDFVAPMIRGLFLPEEGELWASNDYSSQEPRLTVHWASIAGARGGEEAAAAWRANPDMDLHQMVADLCGISRKAAKTINLGIIYGMGGKTLCENLGLKTREIPHWSKQGEFVTVAGEEGQALIDKYNKTVPFVSAISKMCISRAKERGFIRTLLGRRCRFELGLTEDEWARKNEMDYMELITLRGEAPKDDGQYLQRKDKWYRDAHKALNRLIQGSAADQTKKAMLDVYRAGKVPLTTVHDEIGFSVRSEAEARELAEIMENAVPLVVPNKVDVEVAETWGASMVKGNRDEFFSREGSLFSPEEMKKIIYGE